MIILWCDHACGLLIYISIYAAFARTVSGSMHGRHQLCTESQHNEEEQIQGQVPL